MKRKYKIIRLNGPTGILFAVCLLIIISAIIAILPIYTLKFLWNNFISTTFAIKTIRLSQAALLWGAIAATIFGYLKTRVNFKYVNMADFHNSNISNTDYKKFIEQIKKEQEENEKIHH